MEKMAFAYEFDSVLAEIGLMFNSQRWLMVNEMFDEKGV